MLRVHARSTGTFITAASVCSLIAGMALIDNDVRIHVSNAFGADRSGELTMAAGRAQDLTQYFFGVLGDYRAAHTELVIFALAGLLLFVLMLRS